MLWPQDGHEGGYDLLTAILRESGKVLVGTTAIGKATRAVLVRWSERTQTLLAHVCTYDERIAWTDLELVREGAKRRDAPAPEMIAIGEQLLDSLSGEFDFAEVSDEYASELDEAIALAASGKPAKAKPKEKAAAPAGDLMAALQASVKAAPAKKAGKKVAA
jgi:DNA end-binding protein Ku